MSRTDTVGLPFAGTFQVLTGNPPFPWQVNLYEEWFANGKFPAVCDLPTGLGKTSVIAIWLIALANNCPKTPRRLVYVVNRRTVVDQTTTEAETYRRRLNGQDDLPGKDRVALAELRDKLAQFAAFDHEEVLAISTLRGQFADNREWSADPARPAIIVGTVDMIGSRLLFSGYGCGFKSRPLHAGFLGQDTLIVHDEAHLEPAFHELLVGVEKEQAEGRTRDFRPLRVMALSATSRDGENGAGDSLTLSSDDRANVFVKERINAKKAIAFHAIDDEKKTADAVADLVLEHKGGGQAILVFLRRVEDVQKVVERLAKAKIDQGQIERLTGTLRGKERDELVAKPVFQRFLPKAADDAAPPAAEGTVYLVCTSAGEVGVNLSADHLICDLTPFDSMAQRFGRVNRFGQGDARIGVVHPAEFDTEKEPNGYEARRKKTLELLGGLPKRGKDLYAASPKALGDLPPEARLAAFTPKPATLHATDILFDAWALTSIRKPMPGRPAVDPYLHGLAEWEPPETHVAWRQEVERLDRRRDPNTGPLFADEGERDDFQVLAESLLDDYPLKPHELLRDLTRRVFQNLQVIARRHPAKPVWIVDADGSVRATTLAEVAGKDTAAKVGEVALAGRTVLLPPSAGGLREGMLDGDAPFLENIAYDVADQWYADRERTRRRRARVWDGEPTPPGMRLIRTVDTKPVTDDDEPSDESDGQRYWRWYELPLSGDGEGSLTAKEPVPWPVHRRDVVEKIEQFLATTDLPTEVVAALRFAAAWHDQGKLRADFQRRLGNAEYDPTDLTTAWAKSDHCRPLGGNYRHEFGSLVEAECDSAFAELDGDARELALHLIAAHHGHARPHFPPENAFDHNAPPDRWAAVCRETPRRFARLQRKYGRWGLAYIESLLRAADWAASATPSEFVDNHKEAQT